MMPCEHTLPHLPAVSSSEGFVPGHHDVRMTPRLHTSAGGPKYLDPSKTSGAAWAGCRRMCLASLQVVFGAQTEVCSKEQVSRFRSGCTEPRPRPWFRADGSGRKGRWAASSVLRPCSSRARGVSPAHVVHNRDGRIFRVNEIEDFDGVFMV